MAEPIRESGAENPLIPKTEDLPAGTRPGLVDWASFGVTGAIALTVYLNTLARDLTLGWSGVLSAGAMHAGVPSPPGYPLWTIYSWLFTQWLPFSNIAWRVAVGSAVATAVACALIALMVSRSGTLLFSDTPVFSRLKLCEQQWLRGVCGGVAGLVLAFSGAVWNTAVIVEIWALSLLLFVGVLCLFMRWMFGPRRKRLLFAAFLLLGLGLTISQQLIVALPAMICAVMLSDQRLGRDLALMVLPLGANVTSPNQWGIWIVFPGKLNWPMLTVFALASAAGLMVAVRQRRVGSEWKPTMLCGAGLLTGLALYLYAPVASMSNPPVNWSYPRNPEGFWQLVARGQYEHAVPTDSFDLFMRQLGMAAEITLRQLGWPGAAAAIVALLALPQMSRTGRLWMLGLLTIWIAVGPLLLASLNPPPDRHAQELIRFYFAASHTICALWAGIGLIWLGAMSAQTDERNLPDAQAEGGSVGRFQFKHGWKSSRGGD